MQSQNAQRVAEAVARRAYDGFLRLTPAEERLTGLQTGQQQKLKMLREHGFRGY